ncbi:MAG TPA: energy transducer TonB [Pyrinomonadaceae bacterium]|nr:energy transducer TonB [Pyrinomonadaceae bacterium]
MPKYLNALTLALLVAAALCLPARARAQAAPSALAVANETDRQRDGLQGPVRRVRTETAKLVYKAGKVAEGERATLETATYDMKGVKIDNAYFLAAGGALTGREVYKYDERGNIVEMTLLNADGSVMTKERYDYEFDAMGNWTKMLTSVALVENGETKFEPTEVTYRFISYFLQESVAQKLQTGQPAPAAPQAPAPAPPAAAPAVVNASAATKLNPPAASAATQQQQKAAAKPAPPPALALARTPLSGVALVAPAGMPDAASAPAATAGPLVKSDDDLPPPPKKAPVRPVSGGVLNGRALSLPPPAYPEAARRMQTTGTVTVEVVIDVNGRVISAKATGGPVMLREAAERAAMQARFTPALLSGQPVKMSGVINYNFKL